MLVSEISVNVLTETDAPSTTVNYDTRAATVCKCGHNES